MARALRETGKTDPRKISSNFVYQHPTIASLGEYIDGLVRNSVNGGPDAISAMLEMVKKYSVNFTKHAGVMKRPSEETVLVTGTTGGLGSSLLVTLAQSPQVARVYALNRKASTPLYERQKDVLDARGYDGQAVLSSQNVVLLETNMEEDNFGLSEDVYNEVIHSLLLH